MDHDKVAAVALRYIVAAESTPGEVGAVAAPLMTIKAIGLLVALAAVIACLARQEAMSAYEVGIMVGRDALGLVAGVAFFYFHLRIVRMRLFPGSRTLCRF